MKLLEISAEDAERYEKKKKKRNPDPGFSGESCSHHTGTSPQYLWKNLAVCS